MKVDQLHHLCHLIWSLFSPHLPSTLPYFLLLPLHSTPLPHSLSLSHFLSPPSPMAVPPPELLLLHHHHPAEQESHQLKHSLQRLETFLKLLGFYHKTSSSLSLSLSSLAFVLVAAVAPAVVILFFYCEANTSGYCHKYHVKNFELEILIFQVAVAGVSLFCVSRNLRKYGIRIFLFVDECHGYSAQFQEAYVRKIDDFFRLLAVWVLPCLVLKTAREIVRVIDVGNDSLEQSVMTVFILLVSWAYCYTIYLSGSTLFSLVCSLQAIHFENYMKLLQRDLDVLVYIQEHACLTFHLSKISHRFRIFLIFEFVIVTASQIVALLETTGNPGTINFINGADFAISSIVQVAGIIICLHAAAKMSHRAQGLASFASRWHALATCNLNESPLGISSNVGNLYDDSSVVPINYSECDLESSDYELPPSSIEFASYISSYHKRQVFVQYLQSNPGGVTIFGWTVDRALVNTIFSLELSVVTFVLGKTISFSARDI